MTSAFDRGLPSKKLFPQGASNSSGRCVRRSLLFAVLALAALLPSSLLPLYVHQLSATAASKEAASEGRYASLTYEPVPGFQCELGPLLILVPSPVCRSFSHSSPTAAYSEPAQLSISGTPPPPEGDWIVNDVTVVENEQIIVNGSVLIYGTLVLKNCQIYVNCTYELEHGIEVFSGGNLTLLNTLVAALDSEYPYQILVGENAAFLARGCTFKDAGYGVPTQAFWDKEMSMGYGTKNGVSYCPGLSIRTHNASLEDCAFENGGGLSASVSCNLTVRRCTFSNCHLAFLASDLDNLVVEDCAFEGGFYGLITSCCSNWVLQRCSFSEVRYYALLDQYSTNLTVSSCEFVDNGYIGAASCGSTTNYTDCSFVGDSLWLDIYGGGRQPLASQYFVENCTVNGKPLLYFYGENQVFLDDVEAGEVIAIDCNNVTLRNVEACVELLWCPTAFLSSIAEANCDFGLLVHYYTKQSASGARARAGFRVENSTFSYNDFFGVYSTYYDIALINVSLIGDSLWYPYSGMTVENCTVNGKPLLYLENAENLTLTEDYGMIALFNCRNVSIANASACIYLYLCYDVVVENVHQSYNDYGLYFNGNNITLVNSSFLHNDVYGAEVLSQYAPFVASLFNCTFDDGGQYALQVMCEKLTATRCQFSRSVIGVSLNLFGLYRNAAIYLNNFVDNMAQACDYYVAIDWNSTDYGNYWSDYTGVDEDGDGIGDTPYYIDSDSADYMPLMHPWQSYFDEEPPTTQVEIGDPKYSAEGVTYVASQTPITLTAEDNVGVASIRYRIDGGEWNEALGSSTTIYLNGTDGEHTLEYYAIDLSGNEEAVNSMTLYLDNTPPTTAADFDEESLTLTLTATDEGCGVSATYYRVNGGEWQLYAGPIDFSGYEPGNCTVEFYSVDNLGNQEEVKTTTVEILQATTTTMTTTTTTPAAPPQFPIEYVVAVALLVVAVAVAAVAIVKKRP